MKTGLHATQDALLSLFGFKPADMIAELTLHAKPDEFPTLAVTRHIDISNTPGLATKLQRFQVKLVAIDEFTDHQEREAARPAFDLDAECEAATRRVLDHIEDRYTVHSRVIAHDFAKSRDHMRSRHAHLKALQPRPYPSRRNFIEQVLANIAKATFEAGA